MKSYDDIINQDRPHSEKAMMPVADRAKIFSSFAALRGFDDSLAQKLRVVVPKASLSEDMKDSLDVIMNILMQKLDNDIHPMVDVIYYYINPETKEQMYIKKTGIVSRIDNEQRFIQIVNDKISFDDIYSIEGVTYEI